MAGKSAIANVLVVPESKLLNMKKQELSEKEALTAVVRGDKEAYQVIVARYKKAAYYVALGFVRNPQDALDLSQDAFIRAFYKIKKYDQCKPFYPWFYKLLKNLCLDHLRRQSSRKDIPIEMADVSEDTHKNLELRDELWTAIEELSFAQKEVILLRYFHQYSYKEIAQVIQKPVGSVMSSLHYAKKKLKRFLSPYLGTENSDYPEK